jgi:hypothetical protein
VSWLGTVATVPGLHAATSGERERKEGAAGATEHGGGAGDGGGAALEGAADSGAARVEEASDGSEAGGIGFFFFYDEVRGETKEG